MIEDEWSFFSNYAHVLVCLAQNPQALLREVADKVGVTERTAMRLINQLARAGIVERVKQGRRNYYQLVTSEHLQHPLEAHCTIEELLEPILRSGDPTADPTLTEPSPLESSK
jgi:DNA-binding MarR family transcriptional regulator